MTQSSNPPSSYAVICPNHGQQFLTRDQYMSALRDADNPWFCPTCGARSEFDDLHFEKCELKAATTPPQSSAPWTTEEAIDLCRKLEAKLPPLGFHVALTGGCLYKDGPRKDCDIVIYEVRQAEPDFEKLFEMFDDLGIIIKKETGFVKKTTYQGRSVDFLFPDYGHDNTNY